MKQRFQSLVTKYLAWTITLIVSWSIGVFIVESIHFIDDPWEVWSYGVLNTLLFSSIVALLLAPIYFLLYGKWLHYLTNVIFVVTALFDFVSLFYFTITLVPLDATLFAFDWNQVELISSDFVVFRWYYLLLPLPVAAYFLLTKWFRNRNIIWISSAIIGIFAIASLFLGVQTSNDQHAYTKLIQNKTYFFITSFQERAPTTPQSFQKATQTVQQSIARNYQSKNYPFLHKNPATDPLSPFFELKKTPPHLVFIIVESLSSSFSGNEADEISYTPFLDSLAQHSLYFKNTLATGERTFAVLPSILGSLPHGPKGFTHQRNGYPNTRTLPQWLFKNGYEGTFYYGGHARFDYMDLFMNDQGFSHIYDREEYNYEGTGKKTSIDPVPFGIGDRELLKEVFNTKDSLNIDAPTLDVILTLSMHYPFIVDHQAFYKQRVKEMIAQADVAPRLKEKHRKYVQCFSTFLYTDDALQWYFKQQQSREAHSNTIYIILGDHMMGDIPQNNPLEKYRSPLMIYSPLLKRNKHIRSVNTHLNIAPSLHNLIAHNYSFEAMKSVSWLGSTLDTSRTFQQSKTCVMMRNNRKMNELLHNNYFISGNTIYKVGEQLQLQPGQLSAAKEKRLSELRQGLVKLHKETVLHQRITPTFKSKEFIHSREDSDLQFNDSTDFVNCADVKILKDYEGIELSLTFKTDKNWRTNDTVQPIFIVAFSRDGENYIWERIEINTDEQLGEKQRWQKIFKENLHYSIQPQDRIKVYFWNKNAVNREHHVHFETFSIQGLP